MYKMENTNRLYIFVNVSYVLLTANDEESIDVTI